MIKVYAKCINRMPIVFHICATVVFHVNAVYVTFDMNTFIYSVFSCQAKYQQYTQTTYELISFLYRWYMKTNFITMMNE